MTEIKCLTESSGPNFNTSDSRFSDATMDNFSVIESRELQDTITTEASPINESTDLEMMLDASERCMICPVGEIDRQMEYRCNTMLATDPQLDSENACLLFTIQESTPSDRSTDLLSYLGILDGTESYDPFMFLTSFPDFPDTVTSYLPMLLPKQQQKRLPITLVLDLDETLVHSTLDYCEDADFSFQVCFGTEAQMVYVRQRPHLHVFLEAVAGMFEIIVFTASQSIYAEQLLDILDPDHRLICGRAFRESCVFSDCGYTKDLTILGRDLAKIAIVDNSPQVFQLQVNNGIPIQSWFGDPSDDALISLLPFLETLAVAEDVRPIIAKKFSCQ